MKDDAVVMHTVKDIQRMFQCSQYQAYRLVNAKGFPSIRIGGNIRIEQKALEKWLEKSKGKDIALGYEKEKKR